MSQENKVVLNKNTDGRVARRKTSLGKFALSSLLLTETISMLYHGMNSTDFYEAGSKFLNMNNNMLTTVVKHPYLTFSCILLPYLFKHGMNKMDGIIKYSVQAESQSESEPIKTYHIKSVKTEKAVKSIAGISALFLIPAAVETVAKVYKFADKIPDKISDVMHSAINCGSHLVYVGAISLGIYSISKMSKYIINAYYNIKELIKNAIEYFKARRVNRVNKAPNHIDLADNQNRKDPIIQEKKEQEGEMQETDCEEAKTKRKSNNRTEYM